MYIDFIHRDPLYSLTPLPQIHGSNLRSLLDGVEENDTQLHSSNWKQGIDLTREKAGCQSFNGGEIDSHGHLLSWASKAFNKSQNPVTSS